MKYRTIRFLAPCLLALAPTLATRPAEACGGFFCSQAQPVNQAAERIIFADNGDGTITAVIQILYEGPSENFSWLLPISSVPEGDQLGVASDIAFARLQNATNPQFNLTTTVEGRCRERSSRGGSDDSDSPSVPSGQSPIYEESPVDVEASGVVGAFEYSVISVDPAIADPSAPAREWLTQNGYDVTPGAAALVGPYLADGMFLLALRLTKGADTGSIRPIKITYEAQAPMIPIKLTAVAANEDMGVMTWALSSARAVPFNYNALELNEARVNWFNASANYNQIVTEAADDAGGQGFVTEFAGPSSQLDQVVWQSFDEQTWADIRSRSYSGIQDLFSNLQANYQDWSGFWDAVRRTAALPDSVSFDDFKLCPNCYAEQVAFTPTELLAAIEQDVIEPLRSVQQLIDRAPYTTRLYSTLSAAEMTVDPVFVFNPDLPDVSNLHQANRVVECSSGVYAEEAPWRIDFPQGSSIRGTAQNVGQWPDAVNEQPPNLRVLTLATSGEGAVVADNSDLIDSMLADYNDGIPTSRELGDSGGFCSLPAGSSGRGAPLPLALSLGALLAAIGLRRTRR
jgi:uncharacterized protein DUF2330